MSNDGDDNYELVEEVNRPSSFRHLNICSALKFFQFLNDFDKFRFQTMAAAVIVVTSDTKSGNNQVIHAATN